MLYAYSCLLSQVSNLVLYAVSNRVPYSSLFAFRLNRSLYLFINKQRRIYLLNSIHSIVDSSFLILSSPLVPFLLIKLIFTLIIGIFSKTSREFLGLLGIGLIIKAQGVQDVQGRQVKIRRLQYQVWGLQQWQNFKVLVSLLLYV